MDQLMVVVPVEGLAPQVCKVSIGAEDTKHSVISKVKSQLYSRLKHRLDSQYIFHIPSCCLWGDISDIDCSQYDSVFDDNALLTKREGFTLLFQNTSKQKSPGTTMKGKEQIWNREHGIKDSCLLRTNTYPDSTDGSLTLDEPLKTDYNIRVFGRHDGSTQSRADSPESRLSDVVIVSETDSEDKDQENNGNQCILSGLNTLTFLKRKLFKSRIRAGKSKLDILNNEYNSSRFEIVVSNDAERQSESTGIHNSPMAEKFEHTRESDGDLKDEGIVLEGQWEMSLDTSDAVESEGARDDDVMIVKVESDGHCNSKMQLSANSRHHSRYSQSKMTKSTRHTVKCIELTQADLGTLRPCCWLNDQVINSYMRLLVATYGRKHKLHIMNTFFYTKLCKTGYRGVERWLKEVNMKKLRLLLVPVHLGAHWCLAAINFRRKRIQYFDSMGGTNNSCLQRLRMFLIECSWAGKVRPTMSCWKLFHAKGIPRQHNDSDCGVFVSQFARWLCSVRPDLLRHSRIPFHQENMPQIRRNMLEELRTGRLIAQVF